MEGYFVRIDAREGYAEKVRSLQFITDYSMIIAVRHIGHSKENPHYHLVIRTQVRDQALRVRFRKIFDQGKGNGHMSIKAWDGDIHAVSYLFHEDEFADIILRHNVEDKYLEQAKEINKKIQFSVQEAKSKASWRLEDDVYAYYKSMNLQSVPSSVDIGQQIILMALRNGRYVPQVWLLRAMVQKIQFRLHDGNASAEEEFARKMSENIFRFE